MKTLLAIALTAITTFAQADTNQRIAYVEVAQTIERDGNGNTELMAAAAYGETERVRAIVARGTDVNARGYIGNTALIFAVEEGHMEIARILIEAGANPNASNDYGNTARTLAKGYGQREMVEILKVTPVQNRPTLLATSF